MSVEGTTRGRRTAEFAAGTVFAGYRIERILGRGGMGVVYLATELRLDRAVALKVIRADIADDERFRERFRSESLTAASIEDPRVVTVFAAGEREGLAYVAMRYVDGIDLQRIVSARGPLRPERAAAVIARVAGGLDAVHAAGLVHRDVKPANVIVEGDGDRDGPRAYLTDFGLAKAVASTSGLTATGEVIGTVDYMAPEQIQAERVDARADVYALGGVLYHAVTGEVPFSDRESTAKMWAHLNEPPPSAGSRRSGPGALDPVIRRAMAKNPEERFPSAGDLGRAAVAAVRGEAVTEPEHAVGSGEAAPTAATVRVAPLQPTETHPRRRRRRRGRRIAIALTLLVLAALGAAAFVAVPRLSESDTAPVERGQPVEPSGVTVPNLIGLPLDVAEGELEDLGLESDRIGGGIFGVLVPEDWEVCETAPAPDEVAPPGSTVQLLIDRPGSC